MWALFRSWCLCRTQVVLLPPKLTTSIVFQYDPRCTRLSPCTGSISGRSVPEVGELSPVSCRRIVRSDLERYVRLATKIYCAVSPCTGCGRLPSIYYTLCGLHPLVRSTHERVSLVQLVVEIIIRVRRRSRPSFLYQS